MLYIQTPLFRYHLIEKVYESIPKKDDVIWHIIKSTKRETLHVKFGSNVRIIEVECEDDDIICKRNTSFDLMDRKNYFCLLDDDTIFHPDMYEMYKMHENERNFIVGRQCSVDGRQILMGYFPITYVRVDTGNILCHCSVLDKVRWAPSQYAKDFEFWKECSLLFKEENIKHAHRCISFYNALR